MDLIEFFIQDLPLSKALTLYLQYLQYLEYLGYLDIWEILEILGISGPPGAPGTAKIFGTPSLAHPPNKRGNNLFE